MKKIYLLLLVALIGLADPFSVYAQSFAVQSTTQLIPPYSVYLSDYATAGNEKLQVILIHRDLTQPAYQIRLVMLVEWNGKVIMRTSRSFNPRPISLDPGIPTVISGADLAPYLNSRNIDFVGYSREQYERTKALPEGSYRICFVAYDYRRQDVQVSNDGCTFYYLSKNEPPLTNFPVCGSKEAFRNPQQIIFSWLPRNTSSPTSAGDTEYEFALYETRPAGRNPNDVVLTTQPIFKTILDRSQLVYGPAEPLLLEGLTYVWRVRAIDKNGKDAFRNNGYSEVCTFRYGGFDPLFDVGVVKNLQAEGQTERRGRIWWETGEYESYRVEYRKSGKDYKGEEYEWFYSDTKTGEIKIYDLEPDTEYQTRVQARKNNAFGPSTEIIKFRTTPLRVAQCGEPVQLPQITNTKPLAFATTGMVINARGIDMSLVEVTHLGQDGYYKGIGRVAPKYLGGASFYVKFDRIFIDETRTVVGPERIDFITQGVANMMQEQLGQQKLRQEERQKKENRDQWADTEFHEDIFLYDKVVIDTVTVDANGSVVITDSNGITYTNNEITPIITDAPEKAVIIEDKKGNQWVVESKDGKTTVTKVEGGGLQPGNNAGTTAQQRQHIKALALDIAKTFRKELSDFLNLPLNAPKLGAGPIAEDVYIALPSCMSEYENDRTALRAIFDYTGELQTNTTLQDRLVALLEKDADYISVITKNQNIFEKNTSGFDQLLSAEDWNKAKDESCQHQTAEAKWLYITDYLNTTEVSGDCFTRGLMKGLSTYNWQAAPLVALVETGLCLTEKDKCTGEGYWTQFSYGATNALLQELDIISIADGVVMLIGSQLKNKFECIVKGGAITVIITASTVEEGLHMFSKCVIGIDMTLEEYKAMYGKVKDYVAKNWTDPYLHGQATVFVATLVIPFTKISAISKVKLLNKFKTSSKLSEFGSKIDELEKLSKVADEGGDIGKVVDEFAEAKHADEIIDVAKATEKQLDDVYARISKDPPYDYAPNTIEHKAERWAQYKADKGAAAKDYDAWSNLYNANMNKASVARQVEIDYMNSIGWGKHQVTVKAGNQTRRLDIADETLRKGIEVKSYETGKVYATEIIRGEVSADKFLVEMQNWKIEWVFKGCEPSQPLRALLEEAGIIIKLVP